MIYITIGLTIMATLLLVVWLGSYTRKQYEKNKPVLNRRQKRAIKRLI